MPAPGFIAKAGLTAGRIAVKPFDVPMDMTVASRKVGNALNSTVAATNAAVGTAYMGLEPKGPAKLLGKVFERVNNATQTSEAKADRNTKVVWVPLSEGSSKIGDAIAGPLATHYLKKVGAPDPTNPQMIHELLRSKGYPVPQAAPEGAAPQGAAPAAAPAEAPAPAPQG